MESPILAVLIKTDPEKRSSVYRSLKNINGVVGEPISLDGIPNFRYDTGVEVRVNSPIIYEEIMKLDGVINGEMRVLEESHGLLQGTGILPSPPSSQQGLQLTDAESDAEFEEWAKKQAEKDKRLI